MPDTLHDRFAPTAPLADLLRQRYGADQPDPGPLGDQADAVLRQILSHRSQRDYLDTPLPGHALPLALAAAQSAPSSSNLQAWSVVAVADPDRKARINALSGDQRQIARAPVLLIWLADLSRLRRLATQENSPAEGLDYLESLLIGVIDAALAAQTAALALEALGLGTCYIGAVRNQADAVAAELRLPPEVLPVFGLTVGVPDPARPAAIKPRLPARAVLHHETYDPSPAAEALPTYSATLRAFQTGQGLEPVDWPRQVAARIGTPSALKGRERLKEVLGRLGFGLK